MMTLGSPQERKHVLGVTQSAGREWVEALEIEACGQPPSRSCGNPSRAQMFPQGAGFWFVCFLLAHPVCLAPQRLSGTHPWGDRQVVTQGPELKATTAAHTFKTLDKESQLQVWGKIRKASHSVIGTNTVLPPRG